MSNPYTTAALLAQAENPPNPEPLGEPYISQNGYTCFQNNVAVGAAPVNSFDVLRLADLGGSSFPPLASFSAQVTVTTAELLALHTTPITILTAPATGLVIVIDKATCNYIYATAAYTGTGSNLELETWDGTHATVLQTLADTLLAQTFNAVGVFADNQATNIVDVHSSYLIAQPVRLVTTKAANYTVGAGSVVITVWYHLIPMS
jgi:hypothetical protein